MSKKKRIQEIIYHLNSHSEITVEEACNTFKASPATIRRDFNDLIQKKQVEKAWGGIKRLDGAGQDDPVSAISYRQSLFANEKNKIAEKAASYINDGDIIIIDGGSTTFFLTKYIAQKKIRVITNSILIAYQIDKDRNNSYGAEVFVTGGLSYPNSGLLIGPQAISNILQYNANLAFLSVGGIHGGYATNSNQLVVETERAIIKQSEKIIMLADHSKLGKKSMCQICAMNEIDILITDYNKENMKLKTEIKQSGVEIIEVPMLSIHTRNNIL